MTSDTGVLLNLGTLAISALVFSLFFVRLRLPIVSAQILAGMTVGPYVLGWVNNQTLLGEVSQIGIVLLLFIIGLELDPVQLRRIAHQVVPLTLIEVAIAFAFGLIASYILGLTIIWSIIFAMTASISSTAIVGKIILERRMFQSEESNFLVGLMISEDIVAVSFLILLSSLTTTGITATAQLLRIVEIGLGGLGLVVIAYLVARYFAQTAINYLSSFEVESDEIPFLFGLGLGLAFAIFAAELGYSPGIGAFIIGLSIRGKQSRFLSEKLSGIKDLFLVLFFVSMGSLIDPFSAFDLGLVIIPALVIVIAGKYLGGYTIGRILDKRSKNPEISPSSYGAWLVPRGEFSFVIGQFALTTGIITRSIFSLVGLSVLVTALVGAFFQRYVGSRLAESSHVLRPHTDDSLIQPE